MNLPLPILQLLAKYPELRAVGELVGFHAEHHRDEKAQKIFCEITKLVRRLDFEATGGVDI